MVDASIVLQLVVPMNKGEDESALAVSRFLESKQNVVPTHCGYAGCGISFYFTRIRPLGGNQKHTSSLGAS